MAIHPAAPMRRQLPRRKNVSGLPVGGFPSPHPRRWRQPARRSALCSDMPNGRGRAELCSARAKCGSELCSETAACREFAFSRQTSKSVIRCSADNYLAVCSRTWAEIHSMAGTSATVSSLFTFSWRLDRSMRERRPCRSCETVPAGHVMEMAGDGIIYAATRAWKWQHSRKWPWPW